MINENLELREDVEIELPFCSVSDTMDILFPGVGNPLGISNFVERSRILTKTIMTLSPLIQSWGKGCTSEVYSGIYSIETDRLLHSCIIAWITFGGPKLSVILYCSGEDMIPSLYIPELGNMINPKTGKPVGWIRENEETDYDFLKSELGDFDKTKLNEINKILEPDWKLSKIEFDAYTVFV